MENNYFQKLSEIACSTEKKNGLTYISWADAWAEVKKIHPDATYTIYENFDGNAFFESKYGIDCKVGVTINGIEHISRLPVMDGANKTLYAESYKYQTKYGEKTAEAANAFDINKTIQRAFTKAIAMHGLGLYVYRGEDFPSEDHDKGPTTSENAPTATDVPKTQYKTTYAAKNTPVSASSPTATSWINEKDINDLFVEFETRRKPMPATAAELIKDLRKTIGVSKEKATIIEDKFTALSASDVFSTPF